MKKVAIGCGVVALLGVLGVGTCSYLGWRGIKELAGDYIEAVQVATSISQERLEQEATTVDGETFAKDYLSLSKQPVLLTGVTIRMDQAFKNATPPNQGGNAFFVAPGIMVTPMGNVPRRVLRPGAKVEVLGIATRLNLQSAIQADIPVVIGKFVEVVGELEEPPDDDNDAPSDSDTAVPEGTSASGQPDTSGSP